MKPQVSRIQQYEKPTYWNEMYLEGLVKIYQIYVQCLRSCIRRIRKLNFACR